MRAMKAVSLTLHYFLLAYGLGHHEKAREIVYAALRNNELHLTGLLTVPAAWSIVFSTASPNEAVVEAQCDIGLAQSPIQQRRIPRLAERVPVLDDVPTAVPEPQQTDRLWTMLGLPMPEVGRVRDVAHEPRGITTRLLIDCPPQTVGPAFHATPYNIRVSDFGHRTRHRRSHFRLM